MPPIPITVGGGNTLVLCPFVKKLDGSEEELAVYP